ncbi:AraC family transcriptional regulator [Flagellimonas oceanensis]|uniref:AraC family transcriptional regulator n=1 Tax=Flagellimonas oceanensis TaxID=2499163 RepID=UPI003BAC81AA
MKLHFLHKSTASHIQYSATEGKEFLKLWHYHPELEMVYIVQGRGTLYVGDFIGHFEQDNIFLLGSNLPHMFDSDVNQDTVSKSIVLHFNPTYLDKLGTNHQFDFLHYVTGICERGMMIDRSQSKSFLPLFNELAKMHDMERNLQALRILFKVSQNKNYSKLGSTNWTENFIAHDNRLNKVLEYIMMHFKGVIDLETVADMAGMNKSSFCRYFKQKTNKTFVDYVNNVRINYACRLLRDKGKKNSISLACFESGFNSLSYFNRIFKKHLGCAPSEYMGQEF